MLAVLLAAHSSERTNLIKFGLGKGPHKQRQQYYKREREKGRETFCDYNHGAD